MGPAWRRQTIRRQIEGDHVNDRVGTNPLSGWRVSRRTAGEGAAQLRRVAEEDSRSTQHGTRKEYDAIHPACFVLCSHMLWSTETVDPFLCLSEENDKLSGMDGGIP